MHATDTPQPPPRLRTTAIAFISVVMGVCLGRWATLRWSLLADLDEKPLTAALRKADAVGSSSGSIAYVGRCLLAMVVGESSAG